MEMKISAPETDDIANGGRNENITHYNNIYRNNYF